MITFHTIELIYEQIKCNFKFAIFLYENIYKDNIVRGVDFVIFFSDKSKYDLALFIV